MSDEHVYRTELNWVDNRRGIVRSPELQQVIEVATPPDFPKGMAGIWSPEHLFIASISSCFMTTFLAIADNSKLQFKGFFCSAEGRVDMVDGTYRVTEVTLRPRIELVASHDRERAARILSKSEAACLISNSVKTTIIVRPDVQQS